MLPPLSRFVAVSFKLPKYIHIHQSGMPSPSLSTSVQSSACTNRFCRSSVGTVNGITAGFVGHTSISTFPVCQRIDLAPDGINLVRSVMQVEPSCAVADTRDLQPQAIGVNRVAAGKVAVIIGSAIAAAVARR